MIILEENFKWHLEAFVSELFIYHFYMYSFTKVILGKGVMFYHIPQNYNK